MKAALISLNLLREIFKRDSSPTLLNANKRTLDVYNMYAQEYIKNTASTIATSPPEMKAWIDNALHQLPAGSRIFEIGSATLRDATYMRSRGYEVTCSDAAQTFLDTLRKAGENAKYLNILDNPVPLGYDMIFANGVFPHFNSMEARQALRNIRQSMEKGSLLALSFKEGKGEGWIEEKGTGPRFTHYWHRGDIIQLLKEEGFEISFQSKNVGAYESHRWINFIAVAK